jgi:hypothetical protein
MPQHAIDTTATDRGCSASSSAAGSAAAFDVVGDRAADDVFCVFGEQQEKSPNM